MSIIIKGMDIPKDCSYCILANEHINGLCKKKYYCRLEADFEHCPLVEIPTPHGRLIDEDEITFHKHLEATGNGQYDEILVAYERDIDLAPTILAEE